MTQDDINVLVDVFTDIKVEAEAVCLALEQNAIPRETIKNLRGEVDEKTIREAVRESLLPALFSKFT